MTDFNPNQEEDELLKTWMERYVPTPVIIDYLLRKAILFLVLANMYALRQVSRLYGFNVRLEVSDRDSWCWDLRGKLPVYRAQVERVE